MTSHCNFFFFRFWMHFPHTFYFPLCWFPHPDHLCSLQCQQNLATPPPKSAAVSTTLPEKWLGGAKRRGRRRRKHKKSKGGRRRATLGAVGSSYDDSGSGSGLNSRLTRTLSMATGACPVAVLRCDVELFLIQCVHIDAHALPVALLSWIRPVPVSPPRRKQRPRAASLSSPSPLRAASNVTPVMISRTWLASRASH